MLMMISACAGGVKHDTYKAVYEKYNAIKSFEAEAEITVKTDKTANTYTVKQYFLAPDNYKTEITAPEAMKGIGYSLSEGKLSLNSSDGEKYSLDDYSPDDRSYVFINDFFAEYYKSEETAVETAGGKMGGCTVLKNALQNTNPYRHSQTIRINNNDFTPESLTTYDIDGNEVICVRYKSFTYNAELDKNIFK